MRVTLRNIEKKYHGRTALKIEDLEFPSGHIVALLGPNGAGKTTLLRLMGGQEKQDSGDILYDEDRTFPNDAVSYLPQKPYIFDMSVFENVHLGIHKSRNDAGDLVLKALSQLEMQEYADRRAGTLSGGEAQRVAIARSLASCKSLVLLDEPTAAIDIKSMKLVEDYLMKVNQRSGTTIVFSTHNPSQAVRIAHMVVVLWGGHIAEMGEPKRVITSPGSAEIRDFIGDWRI